MATLYVHIPFCKKACHYCNFHFSTSLKNKEELIDALCIELKHKKEFVGVDETITSIYFGGGTPSILSTTELDKIINIISKNYHVESSAEFTIECNPDDINDDLLKHYSSAGVNRLSIGVQSFDDMDLLVLNRSHAAQQAIDAINQAASHGFKSLTIDLMYGLPNQTKSKWLKNLELASALPINHISCYNLTVEEKTALRKLIQDKKIASTEEIESAEQFEILMEWASEQGFEHYEISNFARNGNYSQHNSAYWRGSKYIGVGPSAHSFDGFSNRYYNIANNAEYIRNIKSGDGYYEIEALEEHSIYNEYVLTRLRTIWGINAEELKSRFGKLKEEYFLKNIDAFVKDGHITYDGSKYCLSNSGKLIADHISSELFLFS
jgi:oxygen-independent coproporphyrinogen-3 oxidase